MNEGVSLVAQVPLVRKLLVAEQQRLAEQGPLVMEGRDIGTVVFPKTPYKFYIDANPAVRAERRRQQGETDAILEARCPRSAAENCAADLRRRMPTFLIRAMPPSRSLSRLPCGIWLPRAAGLRLILKPKQP